jgi:UDP-glucuronate 4-epimerase
MTFRVLVTGCAGFIGFHCAARLARDGHEVAGIDDLNDYYDVRLKQARLAVLANVRGFCFSRMDIADSNSLDQLFARFKPEYVLHLAAQAGVRHSLHNPRAYMESNLTGFFNILEACRRHRPLHLVFASSSSVYGARAEVPFSIAERTDEPVSFYAATKKANEVMAYSYSHLHGIATTGLRFFTVYGPWGRPDMAYFSFTKAILAGQAIDIFNHGRMQRDFTYIDDIVEGVVRVLARVPGSAGGASVSAAPQRVPYKLYNIGNSSPVRLLDFVETLEALLGRRTPKNFLPMQPGDVQVTCADTADLEADIGFVPATPLRAGLERFVTWYRSFYPGSEDQPST